MRFRGQLMCFRRTASEKFLSARYLQSKLPVWSTATIFDEIIESECMKAIQSKGQSHSQTNGGRPKCRNCFLPRVFSSSH